MKKNIILVSLSLISIVSCRNDNDVNDNSSIVGTWRMSKDLIISGKNGSVISSDPILESDCESKNTYTFSSDGKYSYTNYHKSNNGDCILYKSNNGTYSFSEKSKELTITLNGDPVTSKLYSFSNKEFQLIQEDDSYDYNDDGINDKFITVFVKK